ncbi:uncharacterized protein LOC132316065 [Cornus florida]|uniref:uncharacterized protein LOC132316065 n=1 Tax=Cornus florida TaxID=4283 RepID=UPI0028A1A82D|nr:uncharacterized protein LOC132316065 [Cornus florida]XP_059670549.1 uncharacterized protein LOC132316065 [Cornus florida]
METEELIGLPASSSSDSEKNDIHNSNSEPEMDSQCSNSEIKEDELNGEILDNRGEIGNKDRQLLLAADIDEDLVDNPSILQVSVELTETVAVSEKINCLNTKICTENGFIAVRGGSPISNHEKDVSSISGVKRARVAVDEQPSVHVMYNSLTRDSKRKLGELLQLWSEWHAQHCSASHDSNEVLESGEETYFPALHVGLDKPSAVSFWMDNQTRNLQSKEFVPLESNSVPLYDRGYSLEGGLEIVDASRCFNCGSYNHSMKECPKPRNNVAVNSARKQHKSRRNQSASSRNPTRYYQSSPGGKYDGLRPGVLGAETRQLLGLGELDPPPWLNRMREIGYPPGYIDPEEEDKPSGITIFGEEESKEEKEDGEILEKDCPDPPTKMSVEFPGINAPIPENADERRWAARPSSSDHSRSRSQRIVNHSSEPISTGSRTEQRFSRDYRYEGPPGCDLGFSPALPNHSQRYGYDSSYASYSPGGDLPRSPSFGRSLSDRDRRSPLVHDGSSYNSLPYSSPSRLLSSHRYGSGSFDYRDEDSRHEVHHRHRR